MIRRAWGVAGGFVPLSKSIEMPFKHVPDFMFAAPPYLFGLLGWVSAWGTAHPVLYLIAMLVGPSLGVATKWALNRYSISRQLMVIIQDQRSTIGVHEREIRRIKALLGED